MASRPASPRSRKFQPRVEALENRWLPSGITLVSDIIPGPDRSGQPQLLTNVNGTLFFIATSLAFNPQLWKSDGTAAGTQLVKSFDPPLGGPTDLIPVGNTLFFMASDPVHGAELWKSDGTEAGTGMVKDILPGPFSSNGVGYDAAVVNDILYFNAIDGSDGTAVVELYRSDGTSDGTFAVPGSNIGIDPRYLTNLNGVLLFQGIDVRPFPEGDNSGKLMRYDGSGEITVFADIDPQSSLVGGIVDEQPIVAGNTMFFTALTAINNTTQRELWRSDGTAAGTFMVKDINPDEASGGGLFGGGDFVNANGTLYFVANDGVNGRELWRSDGTHDGTILLRDIMPGVAGSLPGARHDVFAALGTGLVFVADNGVTGEELWFTDGTPDGTRLLKEIDPSGFGSFPYGLTTVGDRVYFGAVTPSAGDNELWKTDGTEAGTVQVAASQLTSGPINLTNVNGTLFFNANDAFSPVGATGRELWRTIEAPGQFQLVGPNLTTVVEGQFQQEYTVYRTDGCLGPVSVTVGPGGGSASAGTDYIISGSDVFGFQTFTWANDDFAPKSFIVTFPDDTLSEPDETVNIVLSNPTGSASVGAMSGHTLTIIRNDPQIIVTPTAGLATTEGGGTATFTIALNPTPIADVTITIASSNPAVGTVSTAMLTFTPANGTTPLTVTITGQDDGVDAGNIAYTIVTGSAETTDPLFAGLTVDDVAITNMPVFTNASFQDEDGDTYTVKLTGPGEVGSLMLDPDGDNLGPISRLVLTGTNPTQSSLTVTVKKGAGGDGRVDIGSIQGTGLKAIAAKMSDLVGEGISLTGLLGSLTVRDIKFGADVIAKGDAASKTKITANEIGDGTVIDLDSAITSLIAARFGDGQIIAPSLGALQIKGDFFADVTLSGQGIAVNKNALNSVKINGVVFGADFNILAGSVGSFNAGRIANSSLFLGANNVLTAGAKIASFTVNGIPNDQHPAFLDSNIAADTVGAVKLRSVGTANPAGTFGVTGKTKITSVTVTTPAFKFNSKAALPQGLSLDADAAFKFVVQRVT